MLSGTPTKLLTTLILAMLTSAALVISVGTSSAQDPTGLESAFSADIHGDFILVGNTNMACPGLGDEHYDPACVSQSISNSQDGATNDAFYMRYAGSTDTSFNSSSAQLTIPADATIEFAKLYWSGNTGVATLEDLPFTACNASYVNSGTESATMPATGSPDVIEISVNGSQPVSITGLISGLTESGPGGEVYTAEAELTGALASVSNGGTATVTIDNIWTPEGNNCHAGWALGIVYALDPLTEPLRRVEIFDGFVRQGSADPTTVVVADGFHGIAADATPMVGVVAFEGDQTIAGDRFFVNGVAISEPRISPALTSNNFFASTVDGAVVPNDPNSWGVDVKTVAIPSELMPEDLTSTALGFDTSGDSFYSQAIAFSVEITNAPEVTTTVLPVEPSTTTIVLPTSTTAPLIDEPAASTTTVIADTTTVPSVDEPQASTTTTVVVADPPQTTIPYVETTTTVAPTTTAAPVTTIAPTTTAQSTTIAPSTSTSTSTTVPAIPVPSTTIARPSAPAEPAPAPADVVATTQPPTTTTVAPTSTSTSVAPQTSAAPTTSAPTEVLGAIVLNDQLLNQTQPSEPLAFTGSSSFSLVLLSLTFMAFGSAILVGGGMAKKRRWQ